MTRTVLHCCAALGLFLSAGCMKLGPDFHRPDIGVPVPEAYQHASAETAGPQAGGPWWHLFGDAELNELVGQALQHNLDIRKAAARVLEVRSQFVETRAERFPGAGLQAQGQRKSLAATATTGSASDQDAWKRQETDSYSLAVAASFELDLWGRLARADEAARADLLQAQENRRTVMQTVVAETVSLYLQVESIERRIRIVSDRIESLRRSLALVEGRYEQGLGSVLDVRQARRALARAEASLPLLRKDLGVGQQRLAVLAGRYPQTGPARSHGEDYFRRLAPVPSGLPSEVLLQRPDVRAAEARLRGLNALVGAAEASRFPSISLTGSFGYTSEDLDRLFRPQSELWGLAMGLAQPVFDAGRRKAGQRAAEARYQQGLADYARTLLTAFSEVEQALLTRKEEVERLDRMVTLVAEARATHQTAEDRYLRGLVDYLAVLESEQARSQAEEDLVLVELAVLANRVALHRALGGTWEEEAEGRPRASLEPEPADTEEDSMKGVVLDD